MWGNVLSKKTHVSTSPSCPAFPLPISFSTKSLFRSDAPPDVPPDPKMYGLHPDGATDGPRRPHQCGAGTRLTPLHYSIAQRYRCPTGALVPRRRPRDCSRRSPAPASSRPALALDPLPSLARPPSVPGTPRPLARPSASVEGVVGRVSPNKGKSPHAVTDPAGFGTGVYRSCCCCSRSYYCPGSKERPSCVTRPSQGCPLPRPCSRRGPWRHSRAPLGRAIYYLVCDGRWGRRPYVNTSANTNKP